MIRIQVHKPCEEELSEVWEEKRNFSTAAILPGRRARGGGGGRGGALPLRGEAGGGGGAWAAVRAFHQISLCGRRRKSTCCQESSQLHPLWSRSPSIRWESRRAGEGESFPEKFALTQKYSGCAGEEGWRHTTKNVKFSPVNSNIFWTKS